MADTSQKRVLIVDDYYMVRKSLSIFLKSFSGMRLIGEAQNGFDALVICRELKPDIVLLDIDMPGINGIETTRRLRALLPDITVLGMVTFGTDSIKKQEMLSAGASNLLHKYAPIDEIMTTVRQAANHQFAVNCVL